MCVAVSISLIARWAEKYSAYLPYSFLQELIAADIFYPHCTEQQLTNFFRKLLQSNFHSPLTSWAYAVYLSANKQKLVFRTFRSEKSKPASTFFVLESSQFDQKFRWVHYPKVNPDSLQLESHENNPPCLPTVKAIQKNIFGSRQAFPLVQLERQVQMHQQQLNEMHLRRYQEKIAQQQQRLKEIETKLLEYGVTGVFFCDKEFSTKRYKE